jgi:hypothetical protein
VAGAQGNRRRAEASSTDLEADDAGGLVRASGSVGADQPDLAVPVRRPRASGPNLGVGQHAVAEREPAAPPASPVVGPLVKRPFHRHHRCPLSLRRRAGEAAQRAVVVTVSVSPPAVCAPSAAASALRHPARRENGKGEGTRREFRVANTLFSSGRWFLFMWWGLTHSRWLPIASQTGFIWGSFSFSYPTYPFFRIMSYK